MGQPGEGLAERRTLMTTSTNEHPRFGYAARIAYDIDSDRPAEMQTYSLDGRRHTTPPKTLAVAKLPALMFQMIEAGYTLSMETVEGSYRCIVALSKPMTDHWRAREAAEKEGIR